MSQYLNIFLKKKETEITISLAEFYTTPARQISSLGAFTYTDNNKLLDNDSVEYYLSIIIEERDKYKKRLEEEICKETEIKQNICKCVSKEVAQMFLENLESNEEYISELKETVEDWTDIINKISFAIEVWKENKDSWELYYCNC